MCYLTDTGRSSGALRVLPGSHHRSAGLHAKLPEAHTADADSLSIEHPAMAEQPGQETIEAQAGDAVVCDYRLLHGTHANTTAARRDCLLVTFAPAWSELPDDVRAHLIRHPAQPHPGEDAAWAAGVLPRYDGIPRDLALSRHAPASFAVDDEISG